MSVDAATVEERWRGRPRVALAVKTLIVALPLAASVVVSLLAAKRLPHPEGAVQVGVWWIALMAISAIVLVLGEAIARRFLPLVALLRLSLLFPGAAPSRIGVARASTRSELRRLSAQVERDGLGTDLATVARTLVVLVGALDVHDRSTRGHSERVRVYADMLGERLGLEDGDRDRLRWAALLHDLGKLRIPVEVLNKRENLTDEDWAIIHRHPEDGEKMLGPLREWLGEWALVVRHHHERWDGEGYPDGLAGEDISLGARVVAVADSYDVMTSIRSYQPRARSAAAAREELVACAGTQYDPSLVRRFLGLSTRRLWLLLGPLAWIAQLPVVGPVLSETAVLTTGRAAIALGTSTASRGGFDEFVASGRARDEPAVTTPPPAPATTAVPASTIDAAPLASEADELTSVAIESLPPTTSGVGVSAGAPTTAAGPSLTIPPGASVSTAPAIPANTITPTIATTTPTAGAPQGAQLAIRPCPDNPAGGTGAPPDAIPDAAAVEAGESVRIPVLVNDGDPDGDLDPSSVALQNEPGKGTVTLLDGALLYTADEGANGADQFDYTVLDSTGACAAARVAVDIG
jgi:hypothetical protein